MWKGSGRIFEVIAFENFVYDCTVTAVRSGSFFMTPTLFNMPAPVNYPEFSERD